MALYLTYLFPRRRLMGAVRGARPTRIAAGVALRFGFDQDPKATSKRIAATTEEIQRLLAAGWADSGA
jgi:hypothetical protein